MNTSSKNKLAKQVASDLIRHEGFRPYAYPDPLSALMKQHPRENWGFEPARNILTKLKIATGVAAKTGAPWTVGVGFTNGITLDSTMQKTPALKKVESEALVLDNALERHLPWYKDASFVVKTILINLAFNMGMSGLLSFKNTLRFISLKDYKSAGANLRKSLYYRQVTRRAEELAVRLETQTIPANFLSKDSYD